MTVSPCFLEEKPLHYQAEIRRIYQRVRYFEACYSKGLTLVNQDTRQATLSSFGDIRSNQEALRRSSFHRSDLFEAELATSAAIMMGLVSEDLSGMFVRTLLTVRDNLRTDILRLVLQQWDPSSEEYMSYFRSVMRSICTTGRRSEDNPCSGGSFLSSSSHS